MGLLSASACHRSWRGRLADLVDPSSGPARPVKRPQAATPKGLTGRGGSGTAISGNLDAGPQAILPRAPLSRDRIVVQPTHNLQDGRGFERHASTDDDLVRLSCALNARGARSELCSGSGHSPARHCCWLACMAGSRRRGSYRRGAGIPSRVGGPDHPADRFAWDGSASVWMDRTGHGRTIDRNAGLRQGLHRGRRGLQVRRSRSGRRRRSRRCHRRHAAMHLRLRGAGVRTTQLLQEAHSDTGSRYENRVPRL